MPELMKNDDVTMPRIPLNASCFSPATQQAFQALLNDSRIQRLRQVLGGFPSARATLVGGAIRDAILTGGTTPVEDVDVVLTGVDAKTVAERFGSQSHPEGEGERCVPLDEDWGIYRIIFLNNRDAKGSPRFLDIANALNNSLNDDLARRDLTLNALALPVMEASFPEAPPELIDLFHGVDDLHARRIRHIHPANMEEDPLRLLRVFRFHAWLNTPEQPATLTPETVASVRRCLPHLRRVANERVAYEWMRLLSAPHCYATLGLMGETGVLEALLPELRALRCIPKNHHHHLPLWQHTLELVKQAESFIPTCDSETRVVLDAPVGQGGTGASLLKMACLLHDVAKPHTWQMDTTVTPARHRFLTHDALGEAITQRIMRRLRLSSSIEKQVAHLVRWHLYPCTFHTESSDKSRLRFYRKMGKHTPLLILLGMADTLSTRGAAFTEEHVTESLRVQGKLLAGYWQTLALRQAPPLLDGRSMMHLLNIPPGPGLGHIIECFRDAQDADVFHTVEEAKEWLLRHYTKR
jgi:tRNA nucleotidyltransferase/poly(A) polymerase